MKKRVLSFLLSFAMLFGIVLGGAAHVEAASIYSVSTVEELKELAAKVNAGEDFSNVKVVLASDIALNEDVVDDEGNLISEDAQAWTPIGTAEHPFTGIFDGKGYTISGLYINNTAASNLGLLGVISEATVYNVFVEDGYLAGKSEVGGVVGLAKSGSMITNCHNLGVSTTSQGRSGGVVGQIDRSDVYNCSNYANVYSNRCSGGIVGDDYRSGKIYNCANYGAVDGKELVGGISGGTTSADIENCLSAGQILYKNGYIIAGGAGDRSIDNCFGLKNEEVNTNIAFGSSKTSAVFADESAEINGVATVNGVECTTVVDALNAWQLGRSDGICYQQWLQEETFPYLELDAIPTPNAMTENTFEDVSADKWYYDEVKYVYDNGLMNGTSSSKFDPSISTSRAMVVTILYRQEGEPAVSGTCFPDVPEGKWYTAAVTWGAENGIVEGYTDGTFQPNKDISRQEMAAIIYRYADYQGNDMSAQADLSQFPDNSEIGWSRTYMTWAVGSGIINGMNGCLKPKDPAQRSHVATILMKYCTNLVD